MKLFALASSLLAMTTVTGCASAVKLENVAGTWSCPRVDGVCADIATLDAELVGSPSVRSIGGGSGLIAAEAGQIAVTAATTVMPARTADEVARIVFAPSIDADGLFHGARAIYAVMKPGTWIEGPIDDVPVQQVSTTSREAPPPVVNTDEIASASVPAAAAETVTRVVRRTVTTTTPRASLQTADLDQSHDD